MSYNKDHLKIPHRGSSLTTKLNKMQPVKGASRLKLLKPCQRLPPI